MLSFQRLWRLLLLLQLYLWNNSVAESDLPGQPRLPVRNQCLGQGKHLMQNQTYQVNPDYPSAINVSDKVNIGRRIRPTW
jgi:hypothetical protein